MNVFKWLWLGHACDNNSWSAMADVWSKYYKQNFDLHLYVKGVDKRLNGVQHYDNVTFDFRRLSSNQILNLYAEAHAVIISSNEKDVIKVIDNCLTSGLPCVVYNSNNWAKVIDYANSSNQQCLEILTDDLSNIINHVIRNCKRGNYKFIEKDRYSQLFEKLVR